MGFVWPFAVYFILVICIEIFLNIRVNRLQHALRITVITEVKNQDKANQIMGKYLNLSFIKQLKPLTEKPPKFLSPVLMQMRRAAALRLFLHAIALIVVFLLIAMS